MCLSPYIKKRPYRTMQDPHRDATNVLPCGKCVQCLRKRKNSWVFRLLQEQKRSSSACFLTLTYAVSPRSTNGFNTLKRKDLQDFHKRLRTHIQRNQEITIKEKLKYYACGEYGTNTKRPHYHSIMFNLPKMYIHRPEIIHKLWSHGHTYVAPSNGKTIQYVCKYVMKGNIGEEQACSETGLLYDVQKEFSLQSKGLGLNYLTPETVKYHVETLSTIVHMSGGKTMSLPRYYRDKIFSKSELKLIYETIQEAAELRMETLFENNINKFEQWKTNEIKKHEKKLQLERLTL